MAAQSAVTFGMDSPSEHRRFASFKALLAPYRHGRDPPPENETEIVHREVHLALPPPTEEPLQLRDYSVYDDRRVSDGTSVLPRIECENQNDRIIVQEQKQLDHFNEERSYATRSSVIGSIGSIIRSISSMKKRDPDDVVTGHRGRSIKISSQFFPHFFPISHVIGQTKMAQKFHIMKLTLTLASVHMI